MEALSEVELRKPQRIVHDGHDDDGETDLFRTANRAVVFGDNLPTNLNASLLLGSRQRYFGPTPM